MCIRDSIAIVYFTVLNPQAGTGNITQTEISMVHTFFNIATTVMLFPASNLIVKIAKKIGRVDEDANDPGTVLLDERMLQTPVSYTHLLRWKHWNVC